MARGVDEAAGSERSIRIPKAAELIAGTIRARALRGRAGRASWRDRVEKYELRISDWSSDVCSSDLVWSWFAPAQLSQGAHPARNSTVLSASRGRVLAPAGARSWGHWIEQESHGAGRRRSCWIRAIHTHTQGR